MNFYESLAHGASLIIFFAVEHLWQATLVGLLAFMVADLLLRRAPARARYIVWVIALIKFVVPSAFIAFAAQEIVFNRLAQLFASDDRSGGDFLIVREMTAPVLSPFAAITSDVVTEGGWQNGLYLLLALGWLAGAIFLFIRNVMRRRRFRQVIETSRALEEGREWRLLQEAKERLGIRRAVRLVVSSGFSEPGLWGAGRRITISLPEGIGERLTDEEIEAVMLHELAHARRRDNLVSHLQMLVFCLFWFHPLVWLINRKLFEERERACDEVVVRACGASEVYTRSILKVLRFCLHPPVAGASGAGGANLRRRLEYIMNGHANRTLNFWHRFAVGASLFAVAAISFISGSFDSNRAVAQTQNAPRDDHRVSTRRMARTQSTTSDFDRQVDADVDEDTSRVDVASDSNYGQEAERAMEEVSQSPDVFIRFENGDNAPMTITEARIKRATREQMQRITHDETQIETFSTLPAVTLVNNTSRIITRVGVRFALNEGGGAVLERVARIEPHATYTFRTGWNELNTTLTVAPEEITARLAAVEFENGERWGRLVPPPQPPRAPEPPDAPPSPERLRVLHRVEPIYPAQARARGIQGDVTVEFTINSQGEVAEARAIDGPEELREAAVEAIRQFRFSPPSAGTLTRTARLGFRIQ